MQDKQQDTPKLISFIIPFYDVPADMLRQCIDSIRQLSLRPSEREIIIVDDGSHQSPLPQLGDMQDDLIYLRQRNAGVAAARNTGLRVAQGAFIQFIDADDMLLQAPYEHVLDLARYGRVDMVMFTPSDRPAAATSYDDSPAMAGTKFMHSHNIHGAVWSYLFSSSILGSLRFTPGIAYGEDEEFTAQLLLRADSVVSTTAQAYYYRCRPASAINRSDMRSRLQRLNDAKTVIISLRQKSATLPPEENVALQRRIAQLTMDYIYNVITLTQSRRYLNRQLDDLRRRGLFPLPDRDYTAKYTWFRRMTNSPLGLTILMRTLPFMGRGS